MSLEAYMLWSNWVFLADFGWICSFEVCLFVCFQAGICSHWGQNISEQMFLYLLWTFTDLSFIYEVNYSLQQWFFNLWGIISALFFFVLLKTQGNIFEYLEIINHYTANNRSDDGNKIQSTLHWMKIRAQVWNFSIKMISFKLICTQF